MEEACEHCKEIVRTINCEGCALDILDMCTSGMCVARDQMTIFNNHHLPVFDIDDDDWDDDDEYDDDDDSGWW